MVGAGFKNLNYIKISKLAIGCLLAFVTADSLGLNYATSIITITLLSIQNTRKDTLTVAVKRVVTFCIASAVAAFLFPFLQYNIASLLLYLLIMISICQLFQIEEGLTMSTVLMLHLWNARSVSGTAILNEAALMGIGILMGILMNSYMPKQIRQINEGQKEIDGRMKQIFELTAARIRGENGGEPDWEGLETMLKNASKRADAFYKNSFHSEADYFLRYVEMRNEQQILLHKVYGNLGRLSMIPEQSKRISDFVLSIAESFHEFNNARTLLSGLYEMRIQFKEGKLPQTRAEFESRAVLYEMVHDLQEILLIKKRFSENVTAEQKKMYWKRQTA